MKIDKRTAVVLAIRECLNINLSSMINDLPYKKTPQFMSLLEQLTVNNVKDYFKLHPACNAEIKRKERQGWYKVSGSQS